MPLLILIGLLLHLVYALGGVDQTLRDRLEELLPVEMAWLGMASAAVEAFLGFGFTRLAVAAAWQQNLFIRNLGIALGIFLVLEGLFRLVFIRAGKQRGCGSLPVMLLAFPLSWYAKRADGE